MVHTDWRRKGGREKKKKKGVRIPTLAVQPAPEGFAGLHGANMGFTFVTVCVK